MWCAISEEWAENPPAHMILGMLHLKKRSRDTGTMPDLMGMFGNGTINANGAG